MTQLDLGNKLGLRFINAEADHQVGNDLCVLLGLADNLNGAVDIEQNLFQTFEQVQLILLAVQVKVHAAADTARTPCRPLVEQFTHAQHAGHTLDEYVKVARARVHQRSQTEQSIHELVRVGAAL